jgi:hypothetical protein
VAPQPGCRTLYWVLLMLWLFYQSGDTNALEELDLSTVDKPHDWKVLNQVWQLSLKGGIRRSWSLCGPCFEVVRAAWLEVDLTRRLHYPTSSPAQPAPSRLPAGLRTPLGARHAIRARSKGSGASRWRAGGPRALELPQARPLHVPEPWPPGSSRFESRRSPPARLSFAGSWLGCSTSPRAAPAPHPRGSS